MAVVIGEKGRLMFFSDREVSKMERTGDVAQYGRAPRPALSESETARGPPPR